MYNFKLHTKLTTDKPLVKCAYEKKNFLISQPKHMLKLMVEKIFTILRSKIMDWLSDMYKETEKKQTKHGLSLHSSSVLW